jgi:hypothetical protein
VVFFMKGTNNRWQNILIEEDSRRYEQRAKAKLGVEGARWLEKG